jgi:hypothetical protein
VAKGDLPVAAQGISRALSGERKKTGRGQDGGERDEQQFEQVHFQEIDVVKRDGAKVRRAAFDLQATGREARLFAPETRTRCAAFFPKYGFRGLKYGRSSPTFAAANAG